MKEQETGLFSWTLLFIVTGVSFLIFTGFLKLLNAEHVGLFFGIGSAFLGIGLFILLRQLILRIKN
ncbi:MAG: hypothetical protein ACHQEB_05705 [Chitinophagales bacterium]